MKELSEDEVQLVVRALEHYAAYLIATQREDRRYQALAERLQRKGPGKSGAGASGQEEAGIVSDANRVLVPCGKQYWSGSGAILSDLCLWSERETLACPGFCPPIICMEEEAVQKRLVACLAGGFLGVVVASLFGDSFGVSAAFALIGCASLGIAVGYVVSMLFDVFAAPKEIAESSTPLVSTRRRPE